MPPRFALTRYSYRSATMGSTFMARRAGTAQAASPTAISKAAAAAYANGSRAVTPESYAESAFIAKNAAPTPSTAPIAARRAPRPSTTASIRDGRAPRAMHTPIS